MSGSNGRPVKEIGDYDRLLLGLNHPMRRQMLERLAIEPSSSVRFAAALNTSVGTAAYHLIKVLHERCRLVEQVDERPRRGAVEKVFALKSDTGPRGLALNRFHQAATAALEDEIDSESDANLFEFFTVAADPEGRQEIGRAFRAFVKRVREIDTRCSTSGDPGLRSLVLGAALFESVAYISASGQR